MNPQMERLAMIVLEHRMFAQTLKMLVLQNDGKLVVKASSRDALKETEPCILSGDITPEGDYIITVVRGDATNSRGGAFDDSDVATPEAGQQEVA